MKSFTTITILFIAAVIFYACGGSGVSGGTSEVTVEISNGGRSASLATGGDSLFARFRRSLGYFVPGPAVAAVLADVYSVRLTVNGPDMVQVVKTEDVAGRSSVRIVVEVPNGQGRSFLVECFDSNGILIFRGTSVADLAGAPIRLAIEMIDLTAYYVDVNIGVDNPGCGAYETPCRSITQALSLSPGNQPVYVRAGNYGESGFVAGGLETFPLVLNPGTALKCIGAGHSSMITASPLSVIIIGDVGASVEGCRIQGGDSAIYDSGFAMTIRNNIISGGGVGLGGDSLVVDNSVSRVKGQSEISPGGISVEGGSPTIRGNTLSGNVIGMSVQAGTPSLVDNIFSCNTGDDLVYGRAGTLDVVGNYWDHVPPRVEPAGDDIYIYGGGVVDDPGASLVANPCTVKLHVVWKTGQGDVIFTPPVIAESGSSGTTLIWAYSQDESVTVSAVPTTSFSFWGGDCASCGSDLTCQVTMDTDKFCSVNFN